MGEFNIKYAKSSSNEFPLFFPFEKKKEFLEKKENLISLSSISIYYCIFYKINQQLSRKIVELKKKSNLTFFYYSLTDPERNLILDRFNYQGRGLKIKKMGKGDTKAD